MEVGRIGIEVEGFVYRRTKHGRLVPMDVYEWICSQDGNGGKDELPILTDVGPVIVKTDAGRHMIELALPPLDQGKIREIPRIIKEALEALPKDWRFFWQGCDPGPGLGWAPKARYRALRRALRLECGNQAWRGVHRMVRIAAVHVHVDVDWKDRRTIRLVNLFNQPPLLVFATEKRIKSWEGWADPRRLPKPRCFPSLEEMEKFWQGIPRLICQKQDGTWAPDLVTIPSVGDPTHEGTVWWWARPRWSLNTLEIRVADSMPPERIPVYIQNILSQMEG